jgi:hypothetical protein
MEITYVNHKYITFCREIHRSQADIVCDVNPRLLLVQEARHIQWSLHM